MHPLKIDPTSLPAKLTEAEQAELARMLNRAGHNVKLARTPGAATHGALLRDTHAELESAIFYNVATVLWEREARKLIEEGYELLDIRPTPLFKQGQHVVYLARLLGSLLWYRKPGEIPRRTLPVLTGTDDEQPMAKVILPSAAPHIEKYENLDLDLDWHAARSRKGSLQDE